MFFLCEGLYLGLPFPFLITTMLNCGILDRDRCRFYSSYSSFCFASLPFRFTAEQNKSIFKTTVSPCDTDLDLGNSNVFLCYVLRERGMGGQRKERTATHPQQFSFQYRPLQQAITNSCVEVCSPNPAQSSIPLNSTGYRQHQTDLCFKNTNEFRNERMKLKNSSTWQQQNQP